MVRKLSADEIRKLGFDWPRYVLVDESSAGEDRKPDLGKMIERMRSSRARYQKQLNAAYAFKRQTGADYSDFTDRFDDYARAVRELSQVISYLEEIIEAAEGGR